MTDDPLDAVPADDARPAPAAAVAPLAPAAVAARAPSRGGRLVKWWLLTSLVLVLACIACFAVGLWNADVSPVHIMIDGDDASTVSIAGASAGIRVLLGIGIVTLLLALLLLVPMVLLLVLCAVAFAVVAGLGLPLAALALALGVLTSPLWLVGVVVWLIVRRRPAPPVTIRA